ncbi:VPLPA-CTERM sorting domain-containing protein [Methylicorpusculum sp.]|uniref:VPLPA-CTERM sorting domain-containing protein n=1 Tax=Methylicorpusculum sp. TaxID=2713644 RepID=UPI00271EB6FD|nr:VPLPA-CTERM sorting domain-containing protein [Methylicorpusculum sp.]MDO9241377.1 VPLPA-CTERM sorting domain-containing protein [Methylicorpusculum sp.]MDP2177022.1 VPLPA-CTERM sorting domain-containing protein [Methylicorpusculum sp.]MDP3529479.1 VPLPA-CTERM sorting domain-containing protein [Methylicorpusculum sp.]MDZ4152695.1 VPLPA-CTERM sorting domain-containing protein [Methylicorpusculum sp.]
MNILTKLTLSTALSVVSGLAMADITNGPNPYAAGYGFDTPQQASWGGWTRGDAGTLYAEWDTFDDASYAGLRTAAPDVGSANTSNAFISWSPGTFAAGTGNLYSFSVPQSYQVEVAGSVVAELIRAVLQVETWGTQLDYSAIKMNGLSPTYSATQFSDPNYESTFGKVDLVQHLIYWDLNQPSANGKYLFNFGSGPHSSLGQVAVDIGAIASSVPAPVPLPAAVWFMGSAMLGLLGFNKQNKFAA